MGMLTNRVFPARPSAWRSIARRILREKLALDSLFPSGRAFMPCKISVDLTYRCNTRCAVCCRHGRDVFSASGCLTDDAFLEKSAFEAVLQELKRLKPTVYFTGGEPLLHPDATSMAAVAGALGSYVSINTNGLLLEERADALACAGVDRVILSVAPTPDLCEQERGVPYERLLAGARALRKNHSRRSPALALNCVITPVNSQRLEGLADMARELGADSVNLQHLMYSNEQRIIAHDAILKEMFNEAAAYCCLAAQAQAVDVEAVQQAVQRLRAAGLRLRLEPDLPKNSWHEYYASTEAALPGRCLAPWTTLVIMPDAGLSCCRPLHIGRAGMDSVKDAWNSSKAVLFRQRLNKGLLPGCARCCVRKYGDAG